MEGRDVQSLKPGDIPQPGPTLYETGLGDLDATGDHPGTKVREQLRPRKGGWSVCLLKITNLFIVEQLTVQFLFPKMEEKIVTNYSETGFSSKHPTACRPPLSFFSYS